MDSSKTRSDEALYFQTAATIAGSFPRKQINSAGLCQSSRRRLSTLNKWLRLESETVPAKVKFQELRLPNPAHAGRLRWSVRKGGSCGCKTVRMCRFCPSVAALHVQRNQCTRCWWHHAGDLRGSFNRLYSWSWSNSKAIRCLGTCSCHNGRRNRIKVLSGTAQVYGFVPTLEKGRFTWPVSEEGHVDLRSEQFSALIHGLEVRAKKNWYRR